MRETIIKLIIAYDRGTLSKKDGVVLRKWIDEREENRILFENYLKMSKFNRMADASLFCDDSAAWEKISRRIRRNRMIRRWTSVAVAASVAVVFGIALPLMLNVKRDGMPLAEQTVDSVFRGNSNAVLMLDNGEQIMLSKDAQVPVNDAFIVNDSMGGLRYDKSGIRATKEVYHTVKTPVGGEYSFTLADGTKVWLNSDSELRFPLCFNGESRNVYVVGEAYFEVTHDKQHPFVVHAEDAKIRVLGTTFNLSAYPEDECIVTTLVNGKVNVDFDGDVLALDPGFQGVVNKTANTLSRKRVETSLYTSWVNGVFEFEDMPLSEISVRLARWYGIHFEFSDKEYMERRFTGVAMKYVSLDEMLGMIEKTTNVRFEMVGTQVRVCAAKN